MTAIRFFRERASLIGWIIVVSFFVTLFAGTVLFGGFFGDSPKAQQDDRPDPTAIATLGDITVRNYKYYQYVNDNVLTFQEKSRYERITPEIIELLQFDAFTRALQFSVLLSEAEKAGYTINRTEKKQLFYAMYSKFDVTNKRELKEKLKQNNIDFDAFVKLQENEAKVQKVLKQLQGSVQVSDQDVDDKYTEINVSHVLVSPKTKDQAGEDDARDKIQSIAEEIDSGLAFAEAALKYSDDPSAKENGGNLGWLRQGQTVREFEKMAFSLEPDVISDPVKTAYGYHIILVSQRRDLERPLDLDYAKEKQAILKRRRNQVVQGRIQEIVGSNKLDINDPNVRAFHAKREANFDESIAAYQTQISAEPGSTLPHYLLAKLYKLLQRPEETKAELLRAEVKGQLNPRIDLPWVHMELAQIYRSEKKWTDMWAQYDKAIELAQLDLIALRELKKILKTHKNPAKRLAKVDAAIADIQNRIDVEDKAALEESTVTSNKVVNGS